VKIDSECLVLVTDIYGAGSIGSGRHLGVPGVSHWQSDGGRRSWYLIHAAAGQLQLLSQSSN